MEYIKRKIIKDLREHLRKPEITLIIGPRQAGKTTVMRILERELKDKNEKTVFFNLDIESDKEHFQSQEFLLKKIQLEIGEGRGYVFIDEIQRKENAGLFLKGLYDMQLPYKFIVSGSGSVELKEKVKESLAGRKRLFELLPLSFEEFVNFKTQYRYENKLLEYFEVERTKSQILLEEYMRFGGYPRIVLEDTLDEKYQEMNEIYHSYVEKDITYLLRVHKVEEFTRLVKLMAFHTGRLINYSELASALRISEKTVKEYLWYLEKTFILHRLTPFYRNPKKELTKSQVVYFYDLGLRNFAEGSFMKEDYDRGFVFQNFVYGILRGWAKDVHASLHYWRTMNGAEVDFVIDMGREVIPIEVKYSSLKDVRISKAFRSFIKKYNPKIAFIVNLDLKEKVNIDNTTVYVIPYYELFIPLSRWM